jgi:hypothetical protein
MSQIVTAAPGNIAGTDRNNDRTSAITHRRPKKMATRRPPF